MDRAEFVLKIGGILKNPISCQMSSIAEEVATIFKKESEHKAQFEGLTRLLDQVFPTSTEIDAENLLKLLEVVVSLESGIMVVSRQFVAAVLQRLDMAVLSSDTMKSIVKKFLEILQSREISYEEQSISLRTKLANILEKEGSFVEAAQVLMGIPAETGQRPLSDVHKMELYLRIGRFLLDGGMVADAEQFVNKASLLQDNNNEKMTVEFKVLYSRMLDSKRKFVDAAQRYYELSLMASLSRQEKEDALARAITCTVLASPGASRTRVLSCLYKDERTSSLPSYGLLRKLFLDRLIKPNELTELEHSLAAHQKKDEHGASIVRCVILEHNMTAVSRLYTNISIETLADLLGVSQEKAEDVAVQMISSGRLSGSIDQIEGFVHFEQLDALRQWDSQILSLCQQVNRVTDLILAAHPQMSVK